MTHPDKDHYKNCVLLASKPEVGVNVIYFSRAKSEMSPLGYYNQNALGRNLALLGNPMLAEVTLNSTTHSVNKWLKLTDYQNSISDDIPATGYVLKGGTVSTLNWSLTIIAGNVPTTSKTPSLQSNVVSLCTVARFVQLLVLTGDATSETLAYLEASQAAHVAKASIFQVPHHGSDGSLPTATFRDTVNPQTLLVSVGLLNDSDNLPRFNVLQFWTSASRLQKKARDMDYWKTPTEVPMSYDDLKSIVSVSWKPYEVLNNPSRTFFWLSDPKDAGPKKSDTGFYGFTNNGYLLYRANEKHDHLRDRYPRIGRSRLHGVT